uniref:NAD(P)(+)--arginine ADP-ribosyltransferase n=1 Tax=Xenopus tropicalis TaxID=8364 RepID=A0A803KCC8_XENTR
RERGTQYGTKGMYLLQSFIKTVVSDKLDMDMVRSSYDDQYENCPKDVEDMIPNLLKSELKHVKFNEVWNKAIERWIDIKGETNVPKEFTEKHAIATLAYTKEVGGIYTEFNTAVRQAGQSRDHSLNKFHYKALHYYLTRAVQMLKAEETVKCYRVYRGTRVPFSATIGKEVRFGQFASSSTDENEAVVFAKDPDTGAPGTNFTITTCHGASISDLSFIPDEKEVLIPPYETFKVTEAITESGYNNITLVSVGTHSNYNCFKIKGKIQLSINNLPLWV